MKEYCVREAVLLAPHTSLRVGGPARYYARPENRTEFGRAIGWANERDLAVVMLGGGTNVLFPDAGWPGLVLHTASLRGLAVDGQRIVAAAGEPLSHVAWHACRAGLAGLEWAWGIPGTVGGAVAMNAGTRDGEIARSLARVDVADSGHEAAIDATALGLAYRTSALLRGELPGVILEAEFQLTRDDPGACIGRAESFLAERMERLPVGASVGCVFRNPASGPTAGQLLDRAGCKGMRVGEVYVSDRHANVILNDGTRNAADVLRLIERMKAAVRDAYETELGEEVIIYG